MTEDRKTYLVTVQIMDGENTYFQKEMIAVNSHPTNGFFIKEIYGDAIYDECTGCWDIGCGQGYPLASVYFRQIVEDQDIEVLRKYGI